MIARDRGDGFHLQMSKLLVVSIVGAIAATGALIITLLVGLPKPPPGSGPDGRPPPPPDLGALAVFPVVTGLFVLAWLAVLIVHSRDQILRRVEASDPDLVVRLREEIAALSERMTEYGEQRETDGYLHGMRAAAAQPTDPVVTPLRRQPPQQS